MKKIALFGTSADPPTAGHKTILEWLSNHYDWVAVWASDNPFKTHQSCLEHRLEMLRLLIKEIDPPCQNIDVYEKLSDRRSLISVQKAKKIWGENPEYSLVIGSDLVEQIRRWYQVQELFKQVKILIIPRPGYQVKKEDLEALSELGGSYQIANLNVPSVSSTAYRETRDKTVVTEPIKDYIHQERLYA